MIYNVSFKPSLPLDRTAAFTVRNWQYLLCFHYYQNNDDGKDNDHDEQHDSQNYNFWKRQTSCWLVRLIFRCRFVALWIRSWSLCCIGVCDWNFRMIWGWKYSCSRRKQRGRVFYDFSWYQRRSRGQRFFCRRIWIKLLLTQPETIWRCGPIWE